MGRRGAREEDYIRALRAIWTLEQPCHDGEFASFANVNAYPRPIQRPSPPIVIGGGSWSTVRCALTMGNGWYGFGITPDQTRKYVEAFQQIGNRTRLADRRWTKIVTSGSLHSSPFLSSIDA